MGAFMAGNLLGAGHELVVHNRTRTKAERLAQRGARVADSPREVAEGSDVIITMLPGPPQVEEVVAGEGGLLEGARDGSLSIMVGGEEDDFERARPLFRIMGETVVHVGGIGAGQVVKACNQIVVALVIEAIAEALVLGSKAGVDPDRVVEVLSGGLASNKVLEVKGEKFLSHEFTPGGKVAYHRKDLGIALAAGREYGVTLPVAALVEQMFGALVAKGRGGWDHSALITLIEEGSGEGAR